jgi:hypothetical protein
MLALASVCNLTGRELKMSYSFKEIPKEQHDPVVFEDRPDAYEVSELHQLPQFEILDEENDQICIVHSQTDAEALVSHLNR